MHKLVVLRNGPLIQALMGRLEEASIEAFCVTERTAMEAEMGGSLSVSVWIRDAGDLERASGIFREVEVEATQVQCPGCGYNLWGHAGKTACPECGLDLTAGAPEIRCASCGEQVPSNFEVCWNCGKELPPPASRAR